jgi:Tfp pilus assembly protein PilZ
VGTHLAINLFLPDDRSEPVQASGQVAWVRPERIGHGVEAGMGIRFTDISDTGRHRLVRMVTSLEQARHGT